MHAIICKIDYLLIAWINTASDLARPHLEDSLPTIKRSLVFAGARIPELLIPASEPDVSPSMAPPSTCFVYLLDDFLILLLLFVLSVSFMSQVLPLVIKSLLRCYCVCLCPFVFYFPFYKVFVVYPIIFKYIYNSHEPYIYILKFISDYLPITLT